MEIGTILVAVTLTLSCYLFHKYFIKIYDYWPKRGVPCVDGALPFFGNTLSLFLFRKDIGKFVEDLYKTHENRSFVGFYQNRNPNLMIRDPEIIKTVLISAFPSFHKNFMTVDPELDPLLAKNPFFIVGDDWKKRRAYLSNILMSSKKLKVLCPTVTKVCEKFAKYIEENVKRSNGAYEVETKDLFTRFTGEVVSSVGFGVEGEFFSNETKSNSFMDIVRGAFEFSFGSSFLFTVVFLVPFLNKFLRISVIPKRLDSFFRDVTSKVIATRRNNDGIVRNDFIQFMLDAHKNTDGEIDEDDVTSSATSFFLDGYETSAVTLVFFAYQLAVNEDVQDKLRREVNDVLEKHGGVISYETLGEMTYMDQALNESMRLCPAFSSLMKQCTERCKIVGNDGIECVVEPGIDLIIPIEFLQNDPKYWQNPEIYDPERFSAESKNDRPKTVFLPFGEGPRVCVGMRFATMQIKAAIATMLRRCRFELSSKTKVPLVFKQAPLKAVEGGLWIKLKPL